MNSTRLEQHTLVRVARVAAAGAGLVAIAGCSVSVTPDDVSIGFTIGAGLSVLANLLYAKMRLEDEPSSIMRLIAFWVGLPTTFLIFLLVEPQDSWIQRRLDRSTAEDGDDDLVAIQEDFEREMRRIRMAGPAPIPVAQPEPPSLKARPLDPEADNDWDPGN